MALGKNSYFYEGGKLLTCGVKMEGKTEKIHQRVIPPSTPLKGNVSDENK